MYNDSPLLSQLWMTRKVTVSKFKMYALKFSESVGLFAATGYLKDIGKTTWEFAMTGYV